VRDAARGDLDQYVADRGRGIRRLFEDKPADACSLMEPDGLHRPGLLSGEDV
jgi:hypothetical protein